MNGLSGGTQPVTLSRAVTADVFYVSVDGIGNGEVQRVLTDSRSLLMRDTTAHASAEA